LTKLVLKQINSRSDQIRERTSFSKLNDRYKVLPYSLPSVGPEADPGVQAVDRLKR